MTGNYDRQLRHPSTCSCYMAAFMQVRIQVVALGIPSPEQRICTFSFACPSVQSAVFTGQKDQTKIRCSQTPMSFWGEKQLPGHGRINYPLVFLWDMIQTWTDTPTFHSSSPTPLSPSFPLVTVSIPPSPSWQEQRRGSDLWAWPNNDPTLNSWTREGGREGGCGW